jgi:hypothetical protein
MDKNTTLASALGTIAAAVVICFVISRIASCYEHTTLPVPATQDVYRR